MPVGIITHTEGPVSHAPHYPCQNAWVVVGAEREVPICVCWFSVHCSGHLISLVCHMNIQKGYPFFFLFLDGKLCTLGHCPLIYSWKARSSSLPWVQKTNVSSTYQTQSLGWSGADWMAPCSRSFINRFAMMGERGEPMAAPCICSKKFSCMELEIRCSQAAPQVLPVGRQGGWFSLQKSGPWSAVLPQLSGLCQ